MFTGIYAAATGMAAAERQHEATAQNLAHINVAGYRRVGTAYSTFGAALAGADPGQPTIGAASQAYVDFQQGPVQVTDQPLDVALSGDGFLAVEDGGGNRLYTRSGVMEIDVATNRLVDTAGRPYAGVDALPADLTPGELNITPDGVVFARGQELGRLEVVKFADNARLIPAGPTLFAAPPGLAAESAPEVRVQQGAREQANFSAASELVALLTGMRFHEAAQKAMTSMSERLRENTTGGR